MLEVCPKCDYPVYYSSDRHPNKKKCYFCKEWVEAKQRDYKHIGKSTRKWNEYQRKRKTFISDIDLMSKNELIQRLLDYNPRNRKKVQRDKALVAMLYLTASRVEEICGLRHPQTREMVTEPLKLGQLEYNELDGNRYLVFNNLRVLKRKKVKDSEGREQPIFRRVPVLIKDDLYLVKMIEDYIDLIQNKKPDTYLFDIWGHTAYGICQRVGGKNNHYWRHLRITHLVGTYGFTDLELQQYVGWANTLMASRYTHLNWTALANKMNFNSGKVTDATELNIKKLGSLAPPEPSQTGEQLKGHSQETMDRELKLKLKKKVAPKQGAYLKEFSF